jgi:hypothetical protein
MKNKFIFGSMLAIAGLFLFNSCKEGLGGDSTLVVYLKHHGNIIKNHVGWPDTVFVKYNTNELPGTKPSDFDTYFVGEVGEDHVHIHGLKAGRYYLYGAGIDSAGPYRVVGGLPIKIKYKDRAAEQNIDLSVTE